LALFLFFAAIAARLYDGPDMPATVIVKRRVPGLSRSGLAAFVTEACRIIRLPGTVTLLITDNREMRSLNSRFRGKDYATDVLSFPAASFTGNTAGDIAINTDIATRNARDLGHSVSKEIKILALHGLLHLAAYDHESDGGEMARRELQLRQHMALPTGLIERAALVPGSRALRSRPRT
jgi:probable rRNA maturation factor